MIAKQQIRLDSDRIIIDSARTTQSFRWSDIDEIETFKLDLFTTDEICLRFRVADMYLEIHESDDGFVSLMEAMKTSFPSIPTDWYHEVMLPAFATNRQTLWRRT